jgi:hypothetical protein
MRRHPARHLLPIAAVASLAISLTCALLQLAIYGARDWDRPMTNAYFHLAYYEVVVYGVAINYWIITIGFATLPAWWIGRATVSKRRVLRRQRAHHCETCGYDLRATPDRCPECGTTTPAAAP